MLRSRLSGCALYNYMKLYEMSVNSINFYEMLRNPMYTKKKTLIIWFDHLIRYPSEDRTVEITFFAPSYRYSLVIVYAEH